jgi:Protein of unknown function (DUF1203)
MIASENSRPPLSFAALPLRELERIRRAGVDDFGHEVRVLVDGTETGRPLRCCLREARVGERITLIAWRPLEEARESVYAEVGPAFVHADDCPGYQDSGCYPEGFRHRQQVLRSYTQAGDMLDTTIADGRTAEAAISGLLDAEDAVVVHSRNVQAGCHMFAVRR